MKKVDIREEYEKMLTKNAIKEIMSYGKNNFEELDTSSSKRKYEQCIKEIKYAILETIELKSPELNRIKTLEVLSVLFPKIIDGIDVEALLGKIKIDRTFLRSDFDIIAETEDDAIKAFYLGSFKHLTTIPLLVHSYMNAIVSSSRFDQDTFGNYTYKRVPSAVAEKIAAFEAEKETFLPHQKALTYLRLSHLQHAINLLEEFDAASYKIAPNTFMHDIYTYQKYDTFMPVIADIYGEALFQAYLKEESNFLQLFQRVLTHQITIQDFLDYYEVSLKNKQTIQVYEKRIERAKRV